MINTVLTIQYDDTIFSKTYLDKFWFQLIIFEEIHRYQINFQTQSFGSQQNGSACRVANIEEQPQIISTITFKNILL